MIDGKLKHYNELENYISKLNEESRGEVLFRHAKKCVEHGVLQMYKDFYRECDGDLNTFFTSLSKKGYGKGEVLAYDKVYSLSFEKCSCKLVKEGYIKSSDFCECSRQSIIHVMNSLQEDIEMSVEMKSTILRGDKECSFIISVN